MRPFLRHIAIIGSALVTIALSCAAQTSVLTQHNDNSRSGLNPNETTLTTSNVNVYQFGKLFSLPAEGQIFAQPLYVPNVTFPGNVTHNVVIVATENDFVYAFDADTGAQLWFVTLVDAAHGGVAGESPVSSSQVSCSNINPLIGITSTPVIDTTTHPDPTVFIEAESTTIGGTTVFQRLHALDITTGNENAGSPIVISGTASGTGDGSQTGTLTFNPLQQLNRPGLLLLNSVIYVAFGSNCDESPFHGWIFAYNETSLAQESVFVTTPNGGLGGIWMSGAGLAADSSGYIYVPTANGTFDTSGTVADFGDTLLKLSTIGSNNTNGILSLSDYFTPYDQANLAANSLDLGSGGALLLPAQSGSHPHEVIQAGKEGTIYLVDRDHMTSDPANLGNPLHYCSNNCTGDPQIVQELPSFLVGGLYGQPAYWNNNIYFWGQNDVLRSIPISNGTLNSAAATAATTSLAFPAAVPEISSNQNVSGSAIIWAIDTSAWYPSPGPAVLYAYDAGNLSNLLWTSSQTTNGRDQAATAVKFATPTIANGKVYVGALNEVDVYGLLPVTVSVTPQSLSVWQGQTQQFTATVTGTSNTAVTWSISPAGVGSIDPVAGLYTPPASIPSMQTVTVTATSQANAAKYGTATIALMPLSAPAISQTLQQPQSVTVAVGSSATFTVGASGGNLSYQWMSEPSGASSFTPISGATSSSYTVASVALTNDGTQFECAVTNSLGSITSSPATLNVFPGATSYVNSATPGTIRNNFSGWVGMTVTIGNSPLTVTSLGRMFAPENTGTHTVKIVNAATGIDVPGASVSVAMSGGNIGSFVYANLPAVTALSANTTYYIVSQETTGGDQWYDLNTTVQTTTAAAETSGVWARDGIGPTYNPIGSAGQSYVPVSFQYATAISQQPQSIVVSAGMTATFSVSASGHGLTYQWESMAPGTTSFTLISGATQSSYTTPPTTLANDGTLFQCLVTNNLGPSTSNAAILSVIPPSGSYVSSTSLGTLRNNYTGWVGMSISVGNSPITITALGRMFAPGNTGTHTIKIINALNPVDIPGASVSVPMSGGTPGSFVYVALATPFTLSANTTYDIVSQESQGGDQWYDINTTVQTTNVASETSGIYTSNNGTVYNVWGTTSQAFVPINFLYYSGVNVTVAPSTATLHYPNTQQFTATVTGTSNTAVNWAVYPANGGSIDQNGLYSTPSGVLSTETVTVTATSQADTGSTGTATITLGPSMLPAITGQPQSVSVNVGAPATFTVVVVGGVSYQWMSKLSGASTFTPISGATTTSYTTPPTAVTNNGTQFECVVTNAYGASTSNPATLSVILPSASYITSTDLGTLRSDFTGWLGMSITTGNSPVTITALGRMFATGNSGTHTIKIVNALNPIDIPGASVSVTMSGGSPGAFSYAYLSAPFTLAANTTYDIVSEETTGGDQWYDSDTTVQTTNVASEINAIYTSNNGTVYHTWASASQSYVPVSFLYYSGINVTVTPSTASLYYPQTQQFTATVTGTSNTAVNWSVGPPLPTSSGGAAVAFLTQESYTGGSWQGVFGADGDAIANVSPQNLPGYVKFQIQNQGTFTWASNPSDSRALETGFGTTIASCWYTQPSQSFTLDVNFTDGHAHEFALYALDWDNAGRADMIQVVDANTGNQLDVENISNFSSGVYLVWNIFGHVTINVTSVGGTNAAVSGVFFGPPQGIGSIDQNGLYTAPGVASNQTAIVTATTQVDSGYSGTATVTVTPAPTSPPVITQQPQSVSVAVGASTTFSVTASGLALSYQWKSEPAGASSFTPITGATSSSYAIPAVTLSNGGTQFECVVTNPLGSVTSSAATITLVPTAPPVVTQQPQSVNVGLGSPATFNVVASGVALTYQWKSEPIGASSFTSISGATSSSYTIPSVALTDGGTQFECVVTNNLGSVTSSTATITLVATTAPVITQQPQSASVPEQATATFTVVAYGVNITYQWWSEAPGGSSFTPITGATSSNYALPAVTLANSGTQFYCVATNPIGSVTSSTVTLTVLSARTNFVTSATLGTLRNNFSGWLGMSVTIGNSPVTVTALGRMFAPGNTGVHTMEIVNAGTGSVVSGTSVSVPLSGGTPGVFVNVNLTAPVTLSANTTYYILSQETTGGDQWYDVSTTLQTTTVATDNLGAYSTSPSSYGIAGSPNQSYGPVNFVYLPPISVTIAPSGVTLYSPDTQQFTATVTGTTDTAVNWTISPTGAGSINQNGLYSTLGVTASQTVTVTATSQLYNTQFASLTVAVLPPAVPVITSQPQSATVAVGATATFSVVATGGALTYQWLSEGPGGSSFTPISGATSNSYTTPAATRAVSGTQYECVVTNGLGTVTSSPATFTVLAPSASYVTSTNLGTARNNYSGWIGMSVTIGNSPVTVTSLGRMFAPGNTGTHTVKIVTAANATDVPGSAVSLSMSGGTLSTFVYAALPAPVTLIANTTYYIVSQETSGGDQWYDVSTTIQTTSAASETSGIYSANGTSYNTLGSTDQTYVPVNFLYTANINVAVAPSGVTLSSSASQQFTATVTGTSDTAVNWTIVTPSSGSNSSSSGPVGTAVSFLSKDTTTGGSWERVYGGDGSAIANVTPQNIPGYATFQIQNQGTYTWASNPSDPRALETGSGTSTIASCWYTQPSTPYTFDVNFTDGNTHQFALYAVDWDNAGRADMVQIVDANTGNQLDSRTLSNFSGGAYLVWNISGHVRINVTSVGGTNAVVSGVFFGPSVNTTAATATFVTKDTNTGGSWEGVYGGDGSAIANVTPQNIPGYATFQIQNQGTYTWASNPSDPRALETGSGTSTIASCWYTQPSTPYTFDVNFTDGNTHQFALYAVDWDNAGRADMVQIVDANTGNQLDARTLSNFSGGAYLVWNISGHVRINVTSAGGTNAVVSGVFFNSTISLYGNISQSGMYTAPSSITSTQTITLTAASQADTTKSASVTVTLVPPSAPAITSQPQNETVSMGSTATFTVVATGGALSYQWWSEAPGTSSFTIVSGATSSSYTTPAATQAASGTQYECVVSNSLGNAISNRGTLSVTPPSTGYVTSATPGTLRNNLTGWVGMSVTIGNSPVTVTALGRMFAPGNSSSHTVKIVNAATGNDVPGGSVSVSMSGGVVGSFVNGNLPAAVTLSANATYYILSQETQSGDQWYDVNTTIQTTSVASETSGIWSTDGTTYNSWGSADEAYVPVNFLYSANITVTVSPSTITLNSSSSQQFTATVTGTSNNGVNWAIGTPTPISNGPVPVGTFVTFLTEDTTTGGSWEGVYGGDGSAIANVTPQNIPGYATFQIQNQGTYTWASNPSDPRALETGSGTSTIASCWYTQPSTPYTFDVNFTDGNTHQFALYAVDWDNAGRADMIQIVDANTGLQLDSRNLSNFSGGAYLVWNISGHVKITVTSVGGTNAVVSGVFFGPVRSAAVATFVSQDTSTGGNWEGVYGADGSAIANVTPQSIPSYAKFQVQNQGTYTWASNPSDPRALETGSGTSRIASCWYTQPSTPYTLDANFTDGNTHQFALYAVDWDNAARADMIQIVDANTGLQLDSRTLSNFSGGAYLVWNISGHVKITVTSAGGTNAVVSGVFFSPTPGLGSINQSGFYTAPSGITTTETVTVTATSQSNGTTYGSATITLMPPARPAITSQPQSQAVTVGSTATFTVAATGGALSYQWWSEAPGGSSFTAISGATASSYTTPTLTLAASGTQYECIITNLVGSVTSISAALTVTVLPPPAITTQPQSVTVAVGSTATFGVVVTGTTLSYQWLSEAPGGSSFTPISAATASSYTTPAVTLAQSGTQYECVVTNNSGSTTTNAVTLTVSSDVAFVTSSTLGTIRNNFTGWLGMVITVGNSPIAVTKLGRWVVPGSTGVHALKIVDSATGNDVPGSLTSIATAGVQSGAFVYASLSSPVNLNPNAIYYVVSQETAGGDYWYDSNTVIQNNPAAAVTAPVYNPGTGFFTITNAAGQSYVPLDFHFTASSATSAPFVASVIAGTARNDVTGWLGGLIKTGANPVTVTQLGRYFVPGNIGTHTVKLVNASTGIDVSGGAVSVNMSTGQAGAFVYGTLSSPVTLSANTTYYLVSQEQQTGDQWYDYNTTVTTTNVATESSSVWTTNGINYNPIGSANQLYIPVNFIYSLP